MDSERMAYERGEDGGRSRPSFEYLLLAARIQIVNPLQQLRCRERALLNTSTHNYDTSYFALRRLTMYLPVGFFFFLVL